VCLCVIVCSGVRLSADDGINSVDSSNIDFVKMTTKQFDFLGEYDLEYDVSCWGEGPQYCRDLIFWQNGLYSGCYGVGH